MKKDRLVGSPERRWTRIDDYLKALAERRTARRNRQPVKARTEPEAPRPLLSTAPFLILIALLAVLAAAIMIVAFPGNRPQQTAQAPAPHEQGVAPKGWFQEAARDFRNPAPPPKKG